MLTPQTVLPTEWCVRDARVCFVGFSVACVSFFAPIFAVILWDYEIQILCDVFFFCVFALFTMWESVAGTRHALAKCRETTQECGLAILRQLIQTSTPWSRISNWRQRRQLRFFHRFISTRLVPLLCFCFTALSLPTSTLRSIDHKVIVLEMSWFYYLFVCFFLNSIGFFTFRTFCDVLFCQLIHRFRKHQPTETKNDCSQFRIECGFHTVEWEAKKKTKRLRIELNCKQIYIIKWREQKTREKKRGEDWNLTLKLHKHQMFDARIVDLLLYPPLVRLFTWMIMMRCGYACLTLNSTHFKTHT